MKSEEKVHEFIDRPRVSVIKKLHPIKTWSPERGRTMYILEIEFENGDIVKYFAQSLAELGPYAEGQKYVYQLSIETVIAEGKDPKSRVKFIFIKHLLPDSVESRLKWVEETHWYIKRAAELAVNSFSNDSLSSFGETEFKERASFIYDWMYSKLITLDFGEKDSKGLDNFLEDNKELFN